MALRSSLDISVLNELCSSKKRDAFAHVLVSAKVSCTGCFHRAVVKIQNCNLLLVLTPTPRTLRQRYKKDPQNLSHWLLRK